MLEEQCRKRLANGLRGHSETIGQRLQRDLEAMMPLPLPPFEACDQATDRVSSQALVRYRINDYSAPVGYGNRGVWIRGYVDQVVIGCGGESEPPKAPPVRARRRAPAMTGAMAARTWSSIRTGPSRPSPRPQRGPGPSDA